jgi:predicted nucleic acid-binding protein
MLIVDTNVLVRCVRGKAMLRAMNLIDAGIPLATTEHNINELADVLTVKLQVTDRQAVTDIERLLLHVRLVPWEGYGGLEQAAAARLRAGGVKDWPALAAALALDWHIWSDDVDYFGVGVPVWSTSNVRLIQSGNSVDA